MAKPIIFVDMQERDNAERDRLKARQFEIEQLKTGGGKLPPELKEELEEIYSKLAHASAAVDPFFLKIKETLNEIWDHKNQVDDHVGGRLPSQRKATPDTELTSHEKALASVFGLMELDSQTTPQLERFVKGVAIDLGEYTSSKELFDNVLAIMVHEGDDGHERKIRAEQWAGVVRTLRAEGVQADDSYLPLKTRQALAAEVGTGEGAAPSAIDIDLPDLEAQSDVEIQANNLRAMQAIYFAAMLEEVKLFQVVDKLVELFQSGMLPLGKGTAGDRLYKYWKESINRLSEVERRNLYARTFGFPGGDASQGNPNREYNDLWLRFVSAVSSFTRQFKIDELLRSTTPFSVSQEQVRKSGRDLASNLSLHGFGIAYFAATELQTQIQEAIDMLSEPDIKRAYGSSDMWGLIDQVATLELGGARNSVRYRTMASAGAIIIRWLAERADKLASATTLSILDPAEISRPSSRPKGVKATVKPTDRDLVDACEQWLAVTGTPDQRVEEYSQPSEGPNTTAGPVRIPDAARELLESVGIQTAPQNGSKAPQTAKVS
jgi:hypothetical protein